MYLNLSYLGAKHMFKFKSFGCHKHLNLSNFWCHKNMLKFKSLACHKRVLKFICVPQPTCLNLSNLGATNTYLTLSPFGDTYST